MTVKLRAEQLVYTRIETEYSPTGKSGFQTVYWSDALSLEQISQIERRVQCYQPFEPSTLRLQFFRLTTGDIVLSQSRIIEPWPEFQTVVDKKGRTGSFVAHCMVLSQQTLHEVGGDPLALLQSDFFMPDLPSLLNHFGNAANFKQTQGRPNGLIAPLDLIFSPTEPVIATEWTGEDGRRLVSLALQAETLTRAGKSVALIGKHGDIIATLQAALALVPFEERLNCSFDTCVDRCNIAPGQYWAVGVKERLGGANYIDVSASQHRVASSLVMPVATDDLYALWVDDVTKNQGSIANAQQYAHTIQLISRAMKKKLPLPKEARNDEAGCLEFLRVHKNQVWKVITEALVVVVGSERIATMITTELQSYLDNLLDLLDTACSRSLDKLGLSNMIYQLVFDDRVVLTAAEWKQIGQLAQRERNYGLLFLNAIAIPKKPNLEMATDSVRQMSPKQYYKILEKYGTSLPPIFFVGGDNTKILVEYLEDKQPELTPDDTYDLYEVLLRSDSTKLLNKLGFYIVSLDPQGRRRLKKLSDKYTTPSQFQRLLEEEIKADDTRSLTGRISSFFRRD